ncbi:MAG: aminotransferase class I/II-fold pyridoxal phosphate-dependent enzyme, partial [Lachnospiraceae bacterium]|nr:aminotransferase class I/II-fold pyridoxal phosphate-dependent enzyme [Lachnospiraceae bacterium]
NPVGRVFTEDELSELLRIFARHGVLVISDEIHQDFHFDGHTQHCLIGVRNRLRDAGEKMPEVIALTAPSKTFNLTALGFSLAMFPDEGPRAVYDAYMKALGEPGVDVLAATAAEAAYRYGNEWLEGVKSVIIGNHRRIRERLAKECPKIRIMDLEGTYLPFMDLRGVVDTAHPKKAPVMIAGSETNGVMAELVQEKAKLAVDYGEWFGKNFAGFIRLNLATHPDIVDEAVTRLLKAVKA